MAKKTLTKLTVLNPANMPGIVSPFGDDPKTEENWEGWYDLSKVEAISVHPGNGFTMVSFESSKMDLFVESVGEILAMMEAQGVKFA